MGVWCELTRNRLIEKTDAVLAQNIEAAQMIGREQPDQMLRGVQFALDFDRLMGVRFWPYSVEKLDAIAPSVPSFPRDFELFRALRLGGGGD